MRIKITLAMLAAAVTATAGLAAMATPASADGEVCDVPGSVITGNLFPNVITGTPYNDVIYGGGGNDTIDGGGGADIIYGENGDDVIRGGGCDDKMFGQNGNDKIDGQAGLFDYGDGGALADVCSPATETQVSC